ncbi:MAG: bifunctional glutamate N-acetyltransferase/amino-acid acetyltransferase ArgJ [Candidatus Omnitrophica bacterium]|nr:bifunctional glutamate N-acetyltransferase/amino-acid acetyltransferase ArgJ [Candidatus Omnitrophota bacterium]
MPGGVTAPQGYEAHGVSAGIKLHGKRDVALIVSRQPALVAGMLTTNKLAAAPVLLCRPILRRGKAQAIIANSGNANACTGPQGMQDAKTMIHATAETLRIDPHLVLVASTGVIGRPMPIRRIVAALSDLALGLNAHGSRAAAEAIMTTDLAVKETAVEFAVPHPARCQGGQAPLAPATRKALRIGGIAKGSGMINPAMATMFAFLTTDAAITLPALRAALRQAVAHSFNAITVDGEMSTNDTVLLLANGAAGHAPIQAGDTALGTFTRGLTHVCETLAKAIVRDGEGASHLVTVEIRGAISAHDAQKAARGIANSLLVKTMVAGRDPNWGRVAAAVGASGAHLNPGRLTIALGGIPVFHHGRPVRVNPLHLKRIFEHSDVPISIHLGVGTSHARIWTCDLTEDYVRINAKYTT